MVRPAVTDNIPFRGPQIPPTRFSKGWRSGLKRADVFHVMATTLHDTVVTCWAIDPPVHGLFHGLLPQKGKRRFCGTGAHGLRSYDWARVEVRPCTGRTPPLGLAHRSVARPAGHLFYIAYCPAENTLDELTGISGSRWAIEECVQVARQESGLDDYQIRRYPGWPRHMTLAGGAHTYLTGLRARELDTDT